MGADDAVVADAFETFRLVTANFLTLHSAEERRVHFQLHTLRRELLAKEFARRQCDFVGIQEARSSEAMFGVVGEYLMVSSASCKSPAAAGNGACTTGVGGCEL